MKVNIPEIQKLLVGILISKKVSKSEAIILANEYLEGELQGKQTHGLMAFPSLMKGLPLKKKPVIIKKKTASYIFVNANYNFGTVVGRKFTQQAIGMAKKQGIAVVFIQNMLSWLRPATLAQYISSQGMIGFVVNNGGESMVAPPGGFEPQIGTNPIGIGVPTYGNDIVVDMATSKRAWGEVRKSMLADRSLPAETYFDKEGNFAKDPNDAYSVVASGGYKGFALGLFVEILAGSMVNMSMGAVKHAGTGYRTVPRGAMILILNPKFSTSLNKFKQENKKLVSRIKQSKKLKGIEEILIPGERALRTRKNNLKNKYVDVKDELWAELLEIKNNCDK